MRSIYRSARGEALVRGWCAAQLDAWAVQHRTQLIEAGGQDTHVLEAGSGPTVVFVAGDRFSAAANLPLLTVLSERFRIVAADVPAQPGLSAARLDTRPTLDWYGGWLADVLATQGDEPCLLLGHSFGGAVTLACPSSNVEGRLAVAPAGLCRLRLPPGLVADFAAWALLPRPATSRRMLRRLLGSSDQPRPELVEWMTLVARHTRPISSSERVQPTRAVPTVIAVGSADVIVSPKRLGPVARDAYGTDLHLIEGSGHLVTEQ